MNIRTASKWVILLIIICGGYFLIQSKTSQPQEGDIIFQVSNAPDSKAIQIATDSKYSHTGIIVRLSGRLYVLEAVQPVQYSELEEWEKRGVDGHYVIKRLKDSSLDEEALQKMKALGEQFLGKDYDSYYDWSDDKLYCSELVWKIYDRGAGVKIGELQKLKEFYLDHPIVQKKLKERYGNNIPYDELVISPARIFNSPKLKTIVSN